MRNEQLEVQRRLGKLKAYEGVIKLLRQNKLPEDKTIIGQNRFSIFCGIHTHSYALGDLTLSRS